MALNQCNFELNVFKLKVFFNIEKIGIWQSFEKKFELTVWWRLTVFELTVPNLYIIDIKVFQNQQKNKVASGGNQTQSTRLNETEH